MWIFDQDDEGLYTLEHETKGNLKDMTLDDIDLLAGMFCDEVSEADELEFYEDEDLTEE